MGDYPFFRYSSPDSLLLAEFGDDVSDLIERLRGTSKIYADSGNDAYVAHITKEAGDALEQAQVENNLLNEAIACCDGGCKRHLSNMRRQDIGERT